MDHHDLHRHIEITDSHGATASADVAISPEPGRTARVSLRAAAGHLTPGIRASLVDAVLDLPEVQNSAHLQAAFPLGDSEMLGRLQQRCKDVNTHPAGTTALMEADIAAGHQPRHGARAGRQSPPAVIASAAKTARDGLAWGGGGRSIRRAARIWASISCRT